MTAAGGQGDPGQNPYGTPYPDGPSAGYPAPPPPGYGQQYGGPQWGPPPKTGTNGLAVAALVLGILPVAGVGAILAIVFGLIARGQIARSQQSGRGMAIAGVVLGSLWIVAFVAIIVVAATHHGHACVGTPGYCPQQ